MLDLAVRPPRPAFRPFDAEAFAWDAARVPDPRARSAAPPDEPPREPRCTPDQPAVAAGVVTAPSDTSLESDARRWIALIRCGDESGLRQLHTALRHRLFACAQAIVRRDELASEIVSTTFMQVWTHAASYDPERGSALGWLMMIVRSRSYDALRRANLVWQRELSMDDDRELNGHSADRGLEPQSTLERQRRSQRVQRALLRLSPIQRQVLSLTTLDGLSQDEASRHLDLPLGTVKSHARRGLAALRTRCAAIGLTTE